MGMDAEERVANSFQSEIEGGRVAAARTWGTCRCWIPAMMLPLQLRPSLNLFATISPLCGADADMRRPTRHYCSATKC
jgi:hypothetical protein